MGKDGPVPRCSGGSTVSGSQPEDAAAARHPPSTRRYPFVWRKGVLSGYSSTRISLWDSLMFGRLAMGFANVRAGTRVLMLVLVQASIAFVQLATPTGVCSAGV